MLLNLYHVFSGALVSRMRLRVSSRFAPILNNRSMCPPRSRIRHMAYPAHIGSRKSFDASLFPNCRCGQQNSSNLFGESFGACFASCSFRYITRFICPSMLAFGASCNCRSYCLVSRYLANLWQFIPSNLMFIFCRVLVPTALTPLPFHLVNY